MEDKETAYQAFMCMLDTAEEKGREVEWCIYNNRINIYSEKNSWIGQVDLDYREEEEKIKTGWFKYKTEFIEYWHVSGFVENPKNRDTFYFSFNDKRKYDEILARINEYKYKETIRKRESLKELLC